MTSPSGTAASREADRHIVDLKAHIGRQRILVTTRGRWAGPQGRRSRCSMSSKETFVYSRSIGS
jgi:hypothetical protein